MHKVLSLLVAFVFMQTQAWALSGGPVYPGAQQSITGTYAGVFVGTTSADAGDAASEFGSNSIGVFSLGVPETNLAQGAIVLFMEGSFFQGGILGLIDPDRQELTGLGQMLRVVGKSVQGGGQGGQGGGISVAFDARADGTIQARLRPGAFGSLRLSGTATFQLKIIDFTTFEFVDQGIIEFDVEGFKQSDEISTPDANSVAGLLNA